MKVVENFKEGQFKGWNIRQAKNGKFHVYKGIVSQTLRSFDTIEDCKKWIDYRNAVFKIVGIFPANEQ